MLILHRISFETGHGSRMMIRFLTVLAGLAIGLCSHRLCTADDGEDLFALAAGYYSQQRWEEAAGKMLTLYETLPDHKRAPEAAFYRGESLMQLERYAPAIESFQHFIDQWPDHTKSPHAIFRVGEAAYLKGDHPVAAEWLRRFVKDHPKDNLREFALPYLGEIGLAANDFAQAQADFENALKQWPTGVMSERCRFGLARAFDGQGEWQEAQRFYSFVGFQGTTELVDEALLNLAILQFQNKAEGDVEETLNGIIEQEPPDPLSGRAWYLIGRSRQAKGNYEQAAEAFDNGIAAVGGFEDEIAPALVYESALTYEQLKRSTDAAERWQLLVNDYPNSGYTKDAIQKQIESAYASQDWERVLELTADEADQADSQSTSINAPLVREYRGRALLESEKYSDAASTFKELIDSRSISDLTEEELSYAYLLGLSLV